MNDIVLKVDQLASYFGPESLPLRAVDNISFEIRPGETFALLGESGCGKTMTALSLMRLLPPSGRIVRGAVEFQGRELLKLSETDMRQVRGAGMSMIFQEPMTSLNPVFTAGQQITESLRAHQGLVGAEAEKQGVAALAAVGIAAPEQCMGKYPHQLSGGMKQRVMTAIALANEPRLLIADEPTTALDATIQAQVLELIKRLQRDRGMSVMLITHDLGVVAEMADRVAVMYAGEIVEQADIDTFFKSPRHPYSQKLFDSLPSMAKRGQELNVIQGFVPSLQAQFKGCRFAPRCDQKLAICSDTLPPWTDIDGQRVYCHLYPEAGNTYVKPTAAATLQNEMAEQSETEETLLQVRDLRVYFPIRAGIFKRTVGYVRAVDGMDIEIPKGRTLALVGESGCGKTTAGKGILHLLKPTAGNVRFAGKDLSTLSRGELRTQRKNFQIIFQDPYASMNPRMLVGDIVAEGLRAQGIEAEARVREQRVKELLDHVGLSQDSVRRYPHEFSGGQRQRISIARALAVRPRLIVCDEPTSALDVSVQAQILNLLKDLQQEFGISYLFISHNISVVAYLAHEVAVMYLGRVVEHGAADSILNQPQHPYTRALLSAVPTLDPSTKRTTIRLEGDMPSPAKPPSGCFFHPRCGDVMPQCHEHYPDTARINDRHTTACHLYLNS